ncbi:MAG: hypothetical protein LBE91_11105 [Tannerella sp.]|jgi:hypothetical protein|nr:hypothetical protein [Tannerella sp.]
MKTLVLKFGMFLLILSGLFSCGEQNFEERGEEIILPGEEVNPVIEGLEKEDNFFYYFDEKIFFQQNREKLLLKSVPDIHWSQIRPLLEDSAFFVSVAFWTERTPYFLLIANDEKPIPLATIEFYKAMPEIVSVSYMYRYLFNSELYEGTYFVTEGARTDEFAVKLKNTTTLEQLQTLAKQNDCTVSGKDQFVENQYNLHVSKTSELNAIQMSKLFYETGLFDFSSPLFHINGGLPLPPQKQTPFYYYFYDVKLYLQQVTDKMLLKFTQDANKEQILAILNSNSSLQPMAGANYEEFPENYVLRVAALETKDGKPIPSTIIESFKARAEVISVSYLYKPSNSQREQDLTGFTDEITVKLKATTTYEQLQELAAQNNCTIGAENQYTKNQYMVYVSKTSRLDALQTSNLFQETRLFQYSEPNFYMFGIFQLNALETSRILSASGRQYSETTK